MHINREANEVTDSLAKEGSLSQGRWIMWLWTQNPGDYRGVTMLKRESEQVVREDAYGDRRQTVTFP